MKVTSEARDLRTDFGLRAALGRLPKETEEGTS